MIYNKTTKQSKKEIQSKIRAKAPEDYNHLATNCTCAIDGVQGVGPAYLAYPSDIAAFLLGCANCNTIHIVGK